MSTALKRKQQAQLSALPPLHNGDRLTQAEFHRRYEQYPEDVKFELIGGIVYMASPLRLNHSDYDDELGFAFGLYRRATPGVQALHGATAILGEESEPQPDLGLRIMAEYGGRSPSGVPGLVDQCALVERYELEQCDVLRVERIEVGDDLGQGELD